jgi:hypothetical protein
VTPGTGAPGGASTVRRPSTARLLGPWLLLALCLLAAVVAVTTDRIRLGGYLLAAGLGATALLRAVLPPRLSGAVATRSRATDVLLLMGSAAAAGVLAYTLNLGSS